MEPFSQARFSLHVRLVNDWIKLTSILKKKGKKQTEIYLKILKLQISTPTCSTKNTIPRFQDHKSQGWFPVRVYWDTGRLGMKLAEQDGVLVVRTRSRFRHFRGFFPSKKRLLPKRQS